MASKADYSRGNRYPMFDFLIEHSPMDSHNRLVSYRSNWGAYDGDHWEVKSEDGVTRLTLNYCKRFVHKSVRFLFGKGITFKVERVKTNTKTDTSVKDDKLARTAIEFFNEVWRKNNRLYLTNEMGKVGSVSGDNFIQIAWMEEDANGNPIAEKDQYAKISVIPPEYCHPIFDPIDRTVIRELTFIYPKLRNKGKGKYEIDVYKETHTDTQVVISINGKEKPAVKQKLGKIPFIHFPNINNPASSFGLSDMEDLFPLNIEYNKKMSQMSDIISYSVAPITIIKGAKAGSVQKNSRKIWSGLPTDAEVFNLELKSDFKAFFAYAEAIKESMHELGYVPSSTLGKPRAISNVSGVAIQMEYEPLSDLTDEKKITYGDGISRVNQMLLEIYSKAGKLPTSLKNEKFVIETIFTDPLPKDRLMKIDEISKEKAIGLESSKGGLQRLSVDNPDKKLKEIEAERIAIAKVDKQVAHITGVVPPDQNKNFNSTVDRLNKQNKQSEKE